MSMHYQIDYNVGDPIRVMNIAENPRHGQKGTILARESTGPHSAYLVRFNDGSEESTSCTCFNLDRMAVLVARIAKTMRCNCDLDNWQPEDTTGHSHVCRIHKAALEAWRNQKW